MTHPTPLRPVHQQLGDQLFRALRDGSAISPLSAAHPGLGIDDAYLISRCLLQHRLDTGERLVGKKIGLTSAAVQDMLGVHQPDFGYLTDAMQFEGTMPISQWGIQPRAEGEIAFIMAETIQGPGLTAADVLAAIASAHACFEVVDSRIRDWKIGIVDTISDNASSGAFVMGPGVDPQPIDYEGCHMVVHKNGARLSEGRGAAALGSPLNCVAWLANTLGRYGIPIQAGEIVLSGSLVPLEPVQPGDHMHVSITGIGETEVRFT